MNLPVRRTHRGNENPLRIGGGVKHGHIMGCFVRTGSVFSVPVPPAYYVYCYYSTGSIVSRQAPLPVMSVLRIDCQSRGLIW